MRKNIVAGNWKMNCTIDEGQKLASEVINMVKDEVKSDTKVILIPPFPLIPSVQALANDSDIEVGAQNCHQEVSGAYTGEVSAPLLASMNLENVVIGHSERREYFGETDELLASKVKVALENNLTPIFCCGEKLEVREAGNHETLVSEQVEKALFGLSEEEILKVIVAYEPVWAIGTGVTASDEQAQEMHAVIRKLIAGKYGESVADEISILYGGSVKPGNAKGLFEQPDVDGGLVGGASLKSRDFVDIIKAF